MGIKFNPIGFSGLDFVGGSSAPVVGPAERYAAPISIASWNLNGSEYELSITAGTHGKGINPSISVYEQVGLNFELVNVSITVDSLGNITLRVSATPDNRFDGAVLII